MGARTVMHASVIRQIGTQYNKFVFVRATCMGHWDVDDRCALIYAGPSTDRSTCPGSFFSLLSHTPLFILSHHASFRLLLAHVPLPPDFSPPGKFRDDILNVLVT